MLIHFYCLGNIALWKNIKCRKCVWSDTLEIFETKRWHTEINIIKEAENNSKWLNIIMMSQHPAPWGYCVHILYQNIYHIVLSGSSIGVHKMATNQFNLPLDHSMDHSHVKYWGTIFNTLCWIGNLIHHPPERFSYQHYVASLTRWNFSSLYLLGSGLLLFSALAEFSYN